MKKRVSTFNAQIARLYQYYESSSSIFTVTIQVTEDCNLNCSYCYQHSKTHKRMSFETAKNFIDKLLAQDSSIKDYIDIKNKKGIVLDFIGGEPLMEIELIEKISHYFILKLIELHHPWLPFFRIHICSNGVLYFNQKVQDFLKKYHDFVCLSITLDGNKELHDECRKDFFGNGSYEKAVAAIQHYQANFCKRQEMGTKLTISPQNINFLFDGVKNFIDLKLYNISFNPVFEDVWNIDCAKIYYEQLKKIIDYIKINNLFEKINLDNVFNYYIGQKPIKDSNWCGGTGAMLALNPDGNFYPCIRYTDTSIGEKQKPYIIGNINEGIGQTEDTKEKIQILYKINRTSQSPDKCLNCPIAGGCAWCSAYNYEEFGTPNKRTTYTCLMHQAKVLATKYYYNAIKEPFKLNIPKEWALNIITENEFNNLLESDF